jgi:hypothetical protein
MGAEAGMATVLDVVPKLHGRLAETRALAERLARALEAEVDLEYGVRTDAKRVHAESGEALLAARRAGVL